MKNAVIKAMTIVTIFAGLSLFIGTTSVLAVVTSDELCTGAAASSAFCQDQQQTADDSLLFGTDGIITKVIQILIIVVTIVSVLVMVIAGIRFVTSSGNPQSAGSARNAIIYAAVGLVIALLAQSIVALVLNRL